MSKSDNIIRFEEALRNDPEKQKAYEAALKKIAEEKSAGSDGEAMVKAAKEIGFDISIEELERCFADKQEMEDEALDSVAGGKDSLCLADYYCYVAWNHADEKDENVACFSDYNCGLVYRWKSDCTSDWLTTGKCTKDCI